MGKLQKALAIFASFTTFVGCTTLAAAETKMTDAVASVEGVGSVYQVSPDRLLFLGGIAGVMFVDDSDGFLHTGEIVCPVSLEISTEAGNQSGEGYCVITGTRGNRVFAEWTCQGEHLKGCEGDFTITGGTGELEGISGSSLFRFRSAAHQIAVDAFRGEANEAMRGLIEWEGLTITMPAE